jgi:gamma-tubulin complex component 6
VRETAADEERFRQLQSYRHEMQHFISVLAGYLSHQILDVSWTQFAAELTAYKADPRSGLDGVLAIHRRYLDRVQFRALLDVKAAPIMQVVTELLGMVLRLRGVVNGCGAVWADPLASVHPSV